MRAALSSIAVVAALAVALALPGRAQADWWGCERGRSVAGVQDFSQRRYDGVQATITVEKQFRGIDNAEELVTGVVGVGDRRNYLVGFLAARGPGRRIVSVVEWTSNGNRQALQLKNVVWSVGSPHSIKVEYDRAPSRLGGGRRWRIEFDKRYVNWIPLDPGITALPMPRVFMGAHNAATPCSARSTMLFTNVRVRRAGSDRWVPFPTDADRGSTNRAYRTHFSGSTTFSVEPSPLAPYPWMRVYSIAAAISLGIALVLVMLWTRHSYVRDAVLTLRMLGGTFLVFLLSLPFFAFGVAWVYGRTESMISAVVACFIEACLALSIPYFAARLVLVRAGARIVSRDEAPALHACVERLCALADLPKPRVAIMSSEPPTAFATGAGGKATIVVNEKLLKELEPRELEAVVAHELAHIANGDAYASTVLAIVPTLVGTLLTLPARKLNSRGHTVALYVFVGAALLPFLIGLWLVWVLTTLLLVTISRHREYVADRSAALLTGAPAALMSALVRIGNEMERIPASDIRDLAAVRSLLIMPLEAPSARWTLDPNQIFPTHPPIDRRLDALSRAARRTRATDREERPRRSLLKTRRPQRRNIPAIAVFIVGLCVTEVFWYPAWPTLGFAGRTFLDIGIAVPALIVGFRGLGRALAGASGLTLATTGVIMCLSPPFFFALGAGSYVFAQLIGWT